jgi:hypothetical protein
MLSTTWPLKGALVRGSVDPARWRGIEGNGWGPSRNVAPCCRSSWCSRINWPTCPPSPAVPLANYLRLRTFSSGRPLAFWNSPAPASSRDTTGVGNALQDAGFGLVSDRRLTANRHNPRLPTQDALRNRFRYIAFRPRGVLPSGAAQRAYFVRPGPAPTWRRNIPSPVYEPR